MKTLILLSLIVFHTTQHILAQENYRVFKIIGTATVTGNPQILLNRAGQAFKCKNPKTDIIKDSGCIEVVTARPGAATITRICKVDNKTLIAQAYVSGGKEDCADCPEPKKVTEWRAFVDNATFPTTLSTDNLPFSTPVEQKTISPTVIKNYRVSSLIDTATVNTPQGIVFLTYVGQVFKCSNPKTDIKVSKTTSLIEVVEIVGVQQGATQIIRLTGGCGQLPCVWIAKISGGTFHVWKDFVVHGEKNTLNDLRKSPLEFKELRQNKIQERNIQLKEKALRQ